jgi:Holliday junction resolvase RusA-like endonuclease
MWDDKLLITIWGRPVPMARHRHTKEGKAYMDSKCRKELHKYTTQMMITARSQGHYSPFTKETAINLAVVFLHALPKKEKHTEKRRKKVTRPDADNLLKMVKDAATKARIWHDDSQVTDLTVSDRYCSSLEDPKTIIKISTWREEEHKENFWEHIP